MSDVDRIKEKADIVDVISSYVTLTHAGKNLKGPCPFHNEKTPSFFVSPERQTYYCFGCGAKGDVISFVEQYEHIDFLGSLKLLAERYGIELTHEKRGNQDHRKEMIDVLEEATGFFEESYASSHEAQKYMEGRGVTKELAREWRIGYAHDEWRSLYDRLHRQGISDSAMKNAGLIKESKDGSRIMDVFRHRIMFPIRDISGRVIAFSGRTLSSDTHTPKYVNSPETELFKKSVTLYGFYEARSMIRKAGYSILVEGQMDVLACHSIGLKHAVASSGTAFTGEQAHILKRVSPKVIILFDSDKAGVTAALRAASIALHIGMEPKIARLPEGTDPADLIQKDKDELKQKLIEAEHAILVATMLIVEEEKKKERVITRITQEVIPLITQIESATLRDHFIEKVAQKGSISREALARDVHRHTDNNNSPTETYTHASVQTTQRHRLREVLAFVKAFEIWQKDSLYTKKREEIMNTLPEDIVEDLYNEADDEDIIFQIERIYEGKSIAEIKSAMDDFMNNLHIEVLKKKYGETQDNKEKFLIRKEIDILRGK